MDGDKIHSHRPRASITPLRSAETGDMESSFPSRPLPSHKPDREGRSYFFLATEDATPDPTKEIVIATFDELLPQCAVALSPSEISDFEWLCC